MPNYRRRFVPYATYFLTFVTYHRRPILTLDHSRVILRTALKSCQSLFPFEMDAIVLLPDHLHVIWKLPEGDTDYPRRVGYFKKEFTKGYLVAAEEAETTMAQKFQGRRGVWQPRYYEHTIEDEDDYCTHFDYIHFNPVKHGLVKNVYEWPYSSFHRWVKADVYPAHWASGPEQLDTFNFIASQIGDEP